MIERAMHAQDLATVTWVRSLARSGAARSIREAAAVSLPELAASIPCAVSTLWRWEQGQRVPRVDLALRYAATLAALLEKR
jgi:DNA-binding transcriptional regulator YiaG